ncbi:class I SAM-dependent methyltransferase [Sphingomonas radiodurans]|uniref:class I SAM-dependent methyltransferase n=1 Tax=Sphingomonas radiodurans TaxID=2890321 RepID=UPI001E395C0D|nr:methyltransferase domain-containing protein [Sphingomonas radiodurans]WBH17035.1 methyltransferase domain-containing protein [Sphingomonas radiodurans]
MDRNISTAVAEIAKHRDRTWAWANFLPSVRSLIETSGAKSVIEIGGGRGPSFSQNEVERFGLSYTSNDISARELSKAPAWVGKAHFDVQSPDPATIAPYAGQFDFAFSKMVMEHVESYERAYANIHMLLKSGGISIAFHPVLYALPFVLNRMVPEFASSALLTKVFPDRTDDGYPKFPAWYSGCYVSPAIQNRLREIGFTNVWQVPFYGHKYYKKIPGLWQAHQAATGFFRDRNMTKMASFAFTIVQK